MDPLLVGVYIVVAVLLITGPAGSLLPFLPGTPLILGAALLHALVTDFSPIGVGRLLMLAGLAALAYVLEYVAGAVGAKKFGGSAWAFLSSLSEGECFEQPGKEVIPPAPEAAFAQLPHPRSWG